MCNIKNFTYVILKIDIDIFIDTISQLFVIKKYVGPIYTACTAGVVL